MIKVKFLLSICCFSAPFVALAETAQQRFCIEQIQRRTAALVARDWPQLSVESNTYIKKCGHVFGADELARAYEGEADAQLNMGQPERALQVTDACLSIHYGEAGCHLNRAEALVMLNRLVEGKISLDRADRLLENILKSLERDMRMPQDPWERELSKARQHAAIAKQEHIVSLRKAYWK